MLPYFAVLTWATALTALGSVANQARGVSPRVRVTERVTPPGQPVQEPMRRVWTIFDLAALLALVAFAGSRIGVGTDYPLYEHFWSITRPDDLDATLAATDQDLGFAFLQFLLRQVTSDSQFLFWVTASLTILPVMLIIKRTSNSPALSILLYVALGSYLLPFNVVRQGLAATILLVAVVWFMDQRRLMFVLLVAVAASIHASALPVAVVLWTARNWRPRARTAFVVIGGGAVLAGLLFELDAFSSIALAINPRYETYLVADKTGIGTYLMIVAKLGLVAICLASARFMNRLDNRYTLYAVIGIATLMVGTQALALARLDIYFSIFLVLALPNAMASRKRPILQIAVVAGAAVYMAMFIANYAGLMGYQSTLYASR